MGRGFRTLRMAILWLATSAVVGCGGSQRVSTLSAGDVVAGGEIVVEGDWDDLLASVDAIVERHALGVIRREQDESRATIELVDVLGRPIRIEAEAVESGIRLEVRAGRFGDPAMERVLAADLTRRLRQLRGVEVAPIEWGG